MNRRNFMRLSLSSVTVGLLAPTLVFANSEIASRAKDIYYTKDAAGRWHDKVATHVPNISVEKASNKTTVKVVTAHEMKGYEHYIVKHTLLDGNYKFIAEHLFDPGKDTVASSEFSLQNYSGTVYALSFCNKHDLWLSAGVVVSARTIAPSFP